LMVSGFHIDGIEDDCHSMVLHEHDNQIRPCHFTQEMIINRFYKTMKHTIK